MPHLRLHVPEEWLRDDFKTSTGFDAKVLLDHLATVVSNIKMPNPSGEGEVNFINVTNLKKAIIPLYYAQMGHDPSKRFLHVTMAAGNDTPGRTAEVRRGVANRLGDELDGYLAKLPDGGLPAAASLTVHVQDIDRDRGYSTLQERKKRRDAK